MYQVKINCYCSKDGNSVTSKLISLNWSMKTFACRLLRKFSGQGHISFLNRFKRKNITKVYVSIFILNDFSPMPSENPEIRSEWKSTTLVIKGLKVFWHKNDAMEYYYYFRFECKVEIKYVIEVFEEIIHYHLWAMSSSNEYK